MPDRNPVLARLMETGILSREQASAIIEEHLSQGKPVADILIEQEFCRERVYLETIAQMLGTEVIEPLIPREGIEESVPAGIARIYGIAPLALNGETLILATSDLPDPAATDDIAFALSRPIDYVVSPRHEIETALQNLYGESTDTPVDLPDELADADIEHAVNATPVIRFVNMVLLQAVKEYASDIHFEPFDQDFRIRYRVDGNLRELPSPPRNMALPVISRIKVIAGLDIAESRLPQDGRIQLTVSGRMIDFRVSTLPTQFGESVVLRVLDRENVKIQLTDIGMQDDLLEHFREDIRKPNGIVLVTGPTGSGKTTTLYAALQEINRPETKILTAEDPVEYDVEGIIQLPIREQIGLSFVSALRSFLRQDPDVIMVGEIRDLETARIAVQASLTGHLVFSTLHTNDAPGSITRLIDMGVEPYLIAASLEAVIAQRLLRTICPECKAAYEPDDELLRQLELCRDALQNRPFYRGTGCSGCNHTGYRGRKPIFEYMPVNDSVRTAIIDQEPTMNLRALAKGFGMRTLREDGIRCMLSGLTTVEEVVQYT